MTSEHMAEKAWRDDCPCGRVHGTSRSRMKVCGACDHIHVTSDVVALSRFTGVTGYRTPDGQIHATREDAQQWLCEKRQEAGCG